MRVLINVKEALFPSVRFLSDHSRDFYQKFKHIPNDAFDNVLGDLGIAGDEKFLMEMLRVWNEEPLFQICYYFANTAHQYIERYGSVDIKMSSSMHHFTIDNERSPIHVNHMNIENFPTLIKEWADILQQEANKSLGNTIAVKDHDYTITDFIVSAYMKTTGIVEIPLVANMTSNVSGESSNSLFLYDTGGQRNGKFLDNVHVKLLKNVKSGLTSLKITPTQYLVSCF